MVFASCSQCSSPWIICRYVVTIDSNHSIPLMRRVTTVYWTRRVRGAAMGVVVTGKRKPVRADARHVVRGQQTRRRILDGARARILREGYESLRLDDLARDAGVTKAAVVKSIGGK